MSADEEQGRDRDSRNRLEYYLMKIRGGAEWMGLFWDRLKKKWVGPELMKRASLSPA